MLVQIGLVLLGKAGERVAVQVIQGVCSKLAHNDRLVVSEFPVDLVSILWLAIAIPADVFIESDHIYEIAERIVELRGLRIGRVLFQEGNDFAEFIHLQVEL